MQERKKRFVKLVFGVVLSTSILLFVLSISFKPQDVLGYGYEGYGYSCSDDYGYGLDCNKQSNNYKKYKKYKEEVKGAKTVYKRNYFKVRYLKKSKNPAINSQFWAMRSVYLAHKFDNKEVFQTLPVKSQEMFKTYKKYRMYWQYKKYKNAVFD